MQPFKLPENWELTEQFKDKINFCGLDLFICGLAAKNIKSEIPTHGSAADWGQEQSEKRAHYELLERISIMENLSTATDMSSKTLIRKSLSNGIATHTDLDAAKKSAALELLERDTVLTHWFLGFAPTQHSFPYSQKSELSISLYEFKTAVTGISTWMTVLEKKETDPKFPSLWFGFGTCQNKERGIQKSWLEALQVACFTHDSERVETLQSHASVELHLDFYLSMTGKQTFKNWLGLPVLDSHPESISLNEVEYEVFQKNIDNETVFTVKAKHSCLRELYFGVPEEFRELAYQSIPLKRQLPKQDYRSLPHPIS